MSNSEDDEIQSMIDTFAGSLPKVLTGLIGPMSDLIKSSTFATVDSLIDARQKMLDSNWPEELADVVVVTIINRNADVAKKIGEAIQQANQTRKSS